MWVLVLVLNLNQNSGFSLTLLDWNTVNVCAEKNNDQEKSPCPCMFRHARILLAFFAPPNGGLAVEGKKMRAVAAGLT